jgi:hypothetical protein
MELVFKIVEELPQERSGKFRWVVNRVVSRELRTGPVADG